MKDPFGREIKNLRISVTKNCNLACFYCHREGNANEGDEMSLSDISRIFDISSQCGMRFVKITGGEPLVRDDIVDIVAEAKKRFEDVSITTNGLLLAEKIKDLRDAGLDRVNLSLDTLNPKTYKRLTGLNKLGEVVDGLQVTKEAGIDPIKINMLMIKDYNDTELQSILEFCGRKGYILQIIEYVASKEGVKSKFYNEHHIDLASVEEYLQSIALESKARSMQKRKRFMIPVNGNVARVELVRPMHNTEFCNNCSRLRVTFNGLLKPCLLSKDGLIDILTPIHDGADDEALKQLVIQAINNREPYWCDDNDS